MKIVERGYVTLAFDPSFNRESGGNVRLVSSPDINTEDFCVFVDYLVCLENVDHNHESRYEELKKLSLMRSKDVQNGNYTNQPSLNLVLKMLLILLKIIAIFIILKEVIILVLLIRELDGMLLLCSVLLFSHFLIMLKKLKVLFTCSWR